MSTRRFALPPRPGRAEQRLTFPCFGGECTVIVADAARPADAAAAAAMAKRALQTWHQRFSRFQADSELSALNASAADELAVSPLLRRTIETALKGARDTGGLVDITLGDEIRSAGYADHMEGEGTDLAAALAQAPPRAPATPHPDERWRRICVEAGRGTVRRPPGLQLDLGGIAKGVFADELAPLLEGFDSYALSCAGDVRVGGRAGLLRPVQITSPFDGSVLHAFGVAAGAVATSGIGRRSWTLPDGRPGHHLLDPGTGHPAFTGIVQATALAPTAAEAEVLAKAAVLSGPARAPEWLTHGGLIVRDDGTHRVLPAPGAPGSPAQASTAGHPGAGGRPRITWKRTG